MNPVKKRTPGLAYPNPISLYHGRVPSHGYLDMVFGHARSDVPPTPRQAPETLLKLLGAESRTPAISSRQPIGDQEGIA